jgi:hypothetical protein
MNKVNYGVLYTREDAEVYPFIKENLKITNIYTFNQK